MLNFTSGEQEDQLKQPDFGQMESGSKLSKILLGGSGGHESMREMEQGGTCRERHNATKHSERKQDGVQGWK